ncbi:hypothetical protein PFISCL1PPCAC_5019, partial [Pristionchus fissidentatus]
PFSLFQMGNDASKGGKPPKSGPNLGSKNPFKSGPSSSVVAQHIENARKSRVLQLKNHGLRAAPDQLSAVAEFLRNLDLSQNKLKELPPFIALFQELKQLHLTDNVLESIPDEIGELRKLEVLNISQNKLKELPKTLVGCKALRTVNAAQNNLTSFPVVLCHCRELDIVNVSSNRITEFPDDIATLMVSELVANQNQLSRLNSVALTKCERLRTLRVEENCLGKEQFDKHLLENSSISLITHVGNLFQDREFQDLPGYGAYQERYTATRKKM